jgi:hypothetical protein
VINLIHQGTGLIFQAQCGLSLVANVVEIREESRIRFGKVDLADRQEGMTPCYPVLAETDEHDKWVDGFAGLGASLTKLSDDSVQRLA